MQPEAIVYGAYGYTGKLIAEELRKRNINFLISGRDGKALAAMATETGLPAQATSLESLDSFLTKFKQARVFINAAGPFIHTADVAARACIRHNIHYVDITGEIAVFQLLEKLDTAAKKARITVVPGAGFDVVPTDCLANWLKKELPNATHLEMAFAGFGGGLSRGTAKTIVTNFSRGTWVREDGKLKNIAWTDRAKEIDFEGKKMHCVPIAWGDLQTAWQSTGIGNISVYQPIKPKLISTLERITFLLKQAWVKKLLLAIIHKKMTGPSSEMRKRAFMIVQGFAVDGAGVRVEKSFKIPEGYTFTAMSTALIVENILKGDFKAGYQTPAMAYGYQLLSKLGVAGFDK